MHKPQKCRRDRRVQVGRQVQGNLYRKKITITEFLVIHLVFKIAIHWKLSASTLISLIRHFESPFGLWSKLRKVSPPKIWKKWVKIVLGEFPVFSPFAWFWRYMTQILHGSLISIVEKNIFLHQGWRTTFYRQKYDSFKKLFYSKAAGFLL